MDAIQQISLLVLIIVAAAAYSTSAIAYHILAPWHESRIGRWYMAQLVVITACMYLILLNRVLGTTPTTPSPITYVIYGLFAIVGTGTAITIITTQVNQTRQQHADDTQPIDVAAPEEPRTLDAPGTQ